MSHGIPVIAIQFLVNLVSLSFLVAWYIYPASKKKTWDEAVAPFIMFHWVRTLGFFAVLPAFSSPRLADTSWAWHVFIGDFASVVLAWIAVILLRAKSPWAYWGAWLFSIVSTLDIVNAGINGFRERVLMEVGMQGFVIAFGVPALIVTQFTIFVILLKRTTWPTRS